MRLSRFDHLLYDVRVVTDATVPLILVFCFVDVGSRVGEVLVQPLANTTVIVVLQVTHVVYSL